MALIDTEISVFKLRAKAKLRDIGYEMATLINTYKKVDLSEYICQGMALVGALAEVDNTQGSDNDKKSIMQKLTSELNLSQVTIVT